MRILPGRLKSELLDKGPQAGGGERHETLRDLVESSLPEDEGAADLLVGADHLPLYPQFPTQVQRPRFFRDEAIRPLFHEEPVGPLGEDGSSEPFLLFKDA